MKIYALVLCLLLAVPAMAANWVEVTTNINGSIYYIDVNSLYKDTHGNIDYWLKVVPKNEKNIPGETFMWGGKKVWHTLTLSGANCETGQSIGPYQGTFYGMQGQVLGQMEEPINWMMVPKRMPTPDSVGAQMHEFVCGYWVLK